MPDAHPTRKLAFALLAVIAVAIAPLLPPMAVWGRLVRLGGIVVAAMVVLELGLFAHSAWPIYAARSDALAAPSWMPLLQRTASEAPAARVIGLDGRLTPDTSGVFGLQSIGAIDALYPARYFDYVRAFLEPTAVDRFSEWPGFDARNAARDPMFLLTGTRWLVQSAGADAWPSLRGDDSPAPIVAADDLIAVRDLEREIGRAHV